MPQPEHPIEKEIASFVSRRAALDLVRELAALGPRTGGTTRGDRAAMLIAGRMRDLGLQVTLIDDPETDVHEALAWSLVVDGRPLASAHPWINAPSISAAGLPLAIDPERGSPAIRGAAVLTSRRGGPDAGMAEAGAALILTDHPATQDRYVDWAFIGEQPEGARVPVFGLSLRDGGLLREWPGQGEGARVSVSLESRNARGRPRTVMAALAGAGPSAGRTIIVCAHGDADGGGPGADDNASGVAATVEVARALSRAARESRLPPDRPQVLFLVWGKEYHSSEAWVRANDGAMASLVAVINYDQVGTGARNALYYEGNDIPANETLLRTMESVAVDHAGGEGFWGAHTSCPSMGGTDAFAFLSTRQGGTAAMDREVAATTVFTAAWDRPRKIVQTEGWDSPGWPKGEEIVIDHSPYYHSAADTPANTTDAAPHHVENAARLVVLTIRRLMFVSQGHPRGATSPRRTGGPARPTRRG